MKLRACFSQQSLMMMVMDVATDLNDILSDDLRHVK